MFWAFPPVCFITSITNLIASFLSNTLSDLNFLRIVAATYFTLVSVDDPFYSVTDLVADDGQLTILVDEET